VDATWQRFRTRNMGVVQRRRQGGNEAWVHDGYLGMYTVTYYQ
jgi:hypothetical protein